MKSDMENPEFKGRRFFWLLDSDWVFNLNKPYLSYYYGKLPNLEHQVAVLKSRGYISDESEAGKNVMKYKFNVALVQQLRGRKI
jgi:hypothetical protein